MKILLLMTLLVSLSLVPAAQGQETRLPACTDAQMIEAQSMRETFDPLRRAGTEIGSLDDLLRLGADQVAWRDAMWAQLPRCNDVFWLGLWLDQWSEAIFMRASLIGAGIADDEHPYADLGRSGAIQSNLLSAELARVATDDAATKDPADALPACSDDERLMLAGDLWNGIVDLINAAYAVDSLDALLDFAGLKLAWRDGIWRRLPPCAEAYEIAVWMHLYSSDLAKLHMLDLFRVDRADNPYGDSFMEGLIQYSTYAQWMEATGTDYRSLPSCAGADIDPNLYDAFARHHDWTDRPRGAVKDLGALAAAHVEWRDSLWAALPALTGCREAYETALLTLQITGDAAAVSALALTGVGLLELGGEYQERVVGAGRRIDRLLREMKADGSGQAGEAARALPQCSDSDLDILFDDLHGFRALQEQALELENSSDVFAFILAMFEWRDSLWTALPGCAEAFEIAALMLQSSGDYAARFALSLAGVPADANPYIAQLLHGVDRTLQWYNAVWAPIEGEVETPGESTTYYVEANGYANLRSCASTDCEIVGVAADGEALEVVDASGDWYEVYIGAGLVGYIPADSLSSDPPADA